MPASLPATEKSNFVDISRYASTTVPKVWVRERSAREKKLHFMIIGAAKAGTTSLHNYLSSHPELYMLPEKEVPFFTNEDYYAKGWDWYSDEFFAVAPPSKLWGKSTPDYLRPRAAIRIREEMPDAKLIALLRNPIDRAYSHYKMMVKRNKDDRTFLQAMEQSLDPVYLREQRAALLKYPDERRYFFGGEYGRMIEAYFDYFPREQLLVLFTEDLKRDPQGVFKQVLQFLGVDETFTPKDLGKAYHLGGTKRKIPLNEFQLQRNPLFRGILKMMPKKARYRFERRFLFWYMIWNTKPDAPDQQMPIEARKRLTEFFRNDVAKLSKLLGKKVPWPEFADI